MAVPQYLGRTAGAGQIAFPAGTQVGDLLIVITRSIHRISDQAGLNGRPGNFAVTGAGAAQVAASGWSWMDWKPNRYAPGGMIFRGEQHSLRALAGTVTNPGGHVQVSTSTPTLTIASAQVLTYRNAAGVGATTRDTWRVPASDNQSVALFASMTPSTVPAGVTPVPAGQLLWTAPATGPFAGPGGAADGENPTLVGVEIMGTSSPNPPLLLEPADRTEVANGVPVEHVWAHQPIRPGGFQDAYRLQYVHQPANPEDDPVVRWWNGLTLVATETDVMSTSSRVELPPSALGENQAVGWSVATREGLDGEWGPYAPLASLSTVQAPTMVITGPTAPVHNTMRPVITFEGTAAPGEVIVGYQIRVADDAGVFVHDSGGQQGNPGQYAAPALADWVNGADYVPWGRVRQTGGAYSAWEQGAPFAVTWDAPQTPTVSAHPHAPGIYVSAQAPGLLAADVERLDGEDWVPVAWQADGGTVHDVLAPYGRPVTYRARTSNVIADVEVYSDWAESGPAISRDRYGYLADATNPARYVRLRQARALPSRHPRQMETTHGLGDRHGMVDKGPALGREGSFVLRTDHIADEDALLDMLQNVPVLIVRRPAEQRYAGAAQLWNDRGLMRIAVNSPIEEDPLADNYPLTVRLFTFNWIEQ